MKKILLFILAIFVLVEAQFIPRTTQKVRWQDLTEAVIDSIRGVVHDSITTIMSTGGIVASDTVNLKELSGTTDSSYAYLTSLSSTNANGGGFFVQMDSAYAENGSGIAFNNATAAKQWVRIDYLNGLPARPEWAGAIPNDALSDVLQINRLINFGINHLIIGESQLDTFLTDEPIDITRDNFQLGILGIIKNMDGDSTLISGNTAIGDSFIVASSTTGYRVGQWVGVSDTTQIEFYGTDRGLAGEITSISNDTLFLNVGSGYQIDADSGGYFGHMNNVILIENRNNITIYGTGEIRGNRYNQVQIHPVYGTAEQQRSACGITVWKCLNVLIKDITIRDGLMHNLAITGDDYSDNQNIKIDNVNLIGGHDKNTLIRFSDYVQVTNIYADSATWEDNLMFYGSNRYINVTNAILMNGGRNGLGLSGDSLFSASNIYTSGNRRGISATGDFINITNANMRDQLFISNTYNIKNVNISNVIFSGANPSTGYIVYVAGNAQNITLRDFKFEGCTGTAFKILELYGGSPEEGAEYVKIIDPLFNNHAGPYYDFSDDANVEIIRSNPRPTPGFSPISDSTKWLWRGDVGKTTEGDSVTIWLDEISGYSATQLTDTKKPLNGSNYIRFDGINDILVVDSPAVAQNITDDDFSISVVVRYDTSETNFLTGKFQDSDDRWKIYILNTTPTDGITFFAETAGEDTTYAYASNCGLSHDALYIITMTFDRSGGAQFYINGGAATTVTDVMSQTSYNMAGDFFIGGQRDLTDNYTDGNIYWVQYDTELKSAQWAFDFYWYIYQWYNDVINTNFPDYTYEKNIRQFMFQAPTVAYQYGDSLNHVYLSSSDSVSYSLNVLNDYRGARQKIDSIVVYLNGDASSIIDSVKLIQNNYGTESVKWSYTTATNCTGSNQTVGLNPDLIYPSTSPLLLRIYYNVNTAIRTYALKVYMRDY